MSLPYLHPFLGLSNGLNTLHAAGGGGPTVGGWVELGRTTLGSANTDITVSSLANKRYLMVLTSITGSTGNQNVFRRFNGDSGSNYSGRYSNNGSADGTETNNTQSFIGGGGPNADSNPDFLVSYITNYTSKEKLGITHSVTQNTAGAGNAPRRDETVFKWVNTSSAISSITDTTNNANTYNSGSEVVVLGWDPADTHTNNFWQELASSTGNATDDTISVSFTAKKYIWIQMYLDPSALYIPQIRYNSDTGSNYSDRYNINGGSDGTDLSQNANYPSSGVTLPQFLNAFIVNNSANEKLGIWHVIRQNTAGAGNAPTRVESVTKWANTSSQISSIQISSYTGGTVLSTDSIIKVYGSD